MSRTLMWSATLGLASAAGNTNGFFDAITKAPITWVDSSPHDSYKWNPAIVLTKAKTIRDCTAANNNCSGSISKVDRATTSCKAGLWSKTDFLAHQVTTNQAQYLVEQPAWDSHFAFKFDAGFIDVGFGAYTALGHGFYCPTTDPRWWYNQVTDSFIWQATSGKWLMGKPSVTWWWETSASAITWDGQPWTDATPEPTPVPTGETVPPTPLPTPQPTPEVTTPVPPPCTVCKPCETAANEGVEPFNYAIDGMPIGKGLTVCKIVQEAEGCDRAVRFSTDGGRTWQSEGTGCPAGSDSIETVFQNHMNAGKCGPNCPAAVTPTPTTTCSALIARSATRADVVAAATTGWVGEGQTFCRMHREMSSGDLLCPTQVEFSTDSGLTWSLVPVTGCPEGDQQLPAFLAEFGFDLGKCGPSCVGALPTEAPPAPPACTNCTPCSTILDKGGSPANYAIDMQPVGEGSTVCNVVNDESCTPDGRAVAFSVDGGITFSSVGGCPSASSTLTSVLDQFMASGKCGPSCKTVPVDCKSCNSGSGPCFKVSPRAGRECVALTGDACAAGFSLCSEAAPVQPPVQDDESLNAAGVAAPTFATTVACTFLALIAGFPAWAASKL